MKETSNRRSVIVGIFIFIGLLIIVVAVLTLGGQKKTFVKAIQVTAIFDNVSGVQAGNNVWYSGVKVGTVKKVTFLTHDSIEVLMNIEKSSSQFIRKDVIAKIGSDGLVGNKIIALSGGTDKAPSIKDGDRLGISVTVSPDDIMNTLQENNKQLLTITANLQTMSQRIIEGEGTLGKLVTDESLYNSLAATASSLQKSAGNTEELTQGLANYAHSLRREGSLTNDLVTDTVVFSTLRTAVVQMKEVANNANSIVENLKSTSQRINENANSPVGVLLNDEKSGEELKQTLINLNKSTGKLDQNMEALKHNFLLRGYFRKQAKKAEKARKDSIENAQR